MAAATSTVFASAAFAHQPAPADIAAAPTAPTASSTRRRPHRLFRSGQRAAGRHGARLRRPEGGVSLPRAPARRRRLSCRHHGPSRSWPILDRLGRLHSCAALGGDMLALVAHLGAGPAILIGNSMARAVPLPGPRRKRPTRRRARPDRSLRPQRARPLAEGRALQGRDAHRLRRPMGAGGLGRLLRLALPDAEARRLRQLQGSRSSPT